MQFEKIPVITVDGPSGSGKGTLSHRIARQLDWHFLDSGALYRVLAFAALKRGIQPDDEPILASLAAKLPVTFSKMHTIVFENQEITQAIRTQACGALASQIAVLRSVRAALLDRQRAFLCPPGLVADGRDMGTVVFPEANLKLFLEASVEQRAKRRQLQLKAHGIDVNLNDVFAEISERDKRDRQRVVAPLMPAQDAVIIDTSNLSIEAVYARVLAEVKRCHIA